MAVSIITKEDLQEFKFELLEAIEKLILGNVTEQKLWLRTSEVKELLNISSGTLQNLRNNGALSFNKIGGIIYYNFKDIEKLINKGKS